ncbi:MAG: hypothetical protein R3275_03705 [Saprospiraceae bacterium]|nr:hypothetical protein [Saprospiraceae bacterium]
MSRLLFFTGMILLSACGDSSDQKQDQESTMEPDSVSAAQAVVEKYDTFTLTTDMSQLKSNEKEVIALLIEAAKIMDELFWFEAFGDRDSLLEQLTDPYERKAALINYGPWDRLGGNKPFIDNFGPKPPGANFYPEDMTKEEFESAPLDDKKSQYTFLRRDDNGDLYTIPYHEQFDEKVRVAAYYLEKASEKTDDDMLRIYLHKRAQALISDEYQESDLAWLDMKNNRIDVVIGPIENYEDQLFGYKTAHEAYVLIKDMEWSRRLEKYAAFLPGLQKGLPVPEEYKQESPGRDVELNAYDVIYYAGDCNAGSKTIAINLPNDEEVQLQKGTRRLQLKNAMRAKFEKILEPIADVLIDSSQRQHITFDAFFSNTMFHEVAHGLGIKNTINGTGTVREALKELYSALEEGKADILGLYMIQQLHEQGELSGDLKDYYITFMTSVFRSVRFGASSAHGKANMIRFNYFDEAGAFTKDEKTGRYTVNFDNLESATEELSEIILTIQGDGDYERCSELVEKYGKIGPELQSDLDRLSDLGVPVDIVFNQGAKVLGLKN